MGVLTWGAVLGKVSYSEAPRDKPAGQSWVLKHRHF